MQPTLAPEGQYKVREDNKYYVTQDGTTFPMIGVPKGNVVTVDSSGMGSITFFKNGSIKTSTNFPVFAFEIGSDKPLEPRMVGGRRRRHTKKSKKFNRNTRKMHRRHH
jgi:hypothetical protein